jgi:hypothetical protein
MGGRFRLAEVVAVLAMATDLGGQSQKVTLS